MSRTIDQAKLRQLLGIDPRPTVITAPGAPDPKEEQEILREQYLQEGRSAAENFLRVPRQGKRDV